MIAGWIILVEVSELLVRLCEYGNEHSGFIKKKSVNVFTVCVVVSFSRAILREFTELLTYFFR